MIPNFRCTEEAVAFGKSATKIEIEKLKQMHKYLLVIRERIKKNFQRNIMTLDIQMEFDVKCQFMREALEAAGEEMI